MKLKITKYAHACLLVETSDRVALFDPGNYSWNSGTFNIERLSRLDNILITHEHADHMHPQFIETLINKFPQAQITTTASALEKLNNLGINKNVTSEDSEGVALFKSSHESMEPLSGAPPDNTGFHFQGLISHPGDGHHFNESMPILALPITAPWGTTARAARIIQELKPKYVIPIHDWLWRDEIRLKNYERLDEFCKAQGINFISPTGGETVEIDENPRD